MTRYDEATLEYERVRHWLSEARTTLANLFSILLSTRPFAPAQAMVTLFS